MNDMKENKPKRIYTRVVLDACTGELLESESYLHAGPLASCKGGKGGDTGSEEMAELSRQLFKETAPLRSELISQYLAALTGGPYAAPDEGQPTAAAAEPERYRYVDTAMPAARLRAVPGAEGFNPITGRWIAPTGRRPAPTGRQQRAAGKKAEGRGETVFAPILRQALEATREGASRGKRQTREELARKGLAGTPFGEQILAETIQAGEQDVSETEAQMLSQILSQAAGMAIPGAQAGIQGMGQAGQIAAKEAALEQQQRSSMAGLLGGGAYLGTEALTGGGAIEAGTGAAAAGAAGFWPVAAGLGAYGLGQTMCFITTAVVRHLGLDDDGPELTVLRWFRDNIMLTRPQWVEQVREYYRIAPVIVSELNRREDAHQLYREFFNTYIIPAVEAVRNENYERAVDLYQAMVSRARYKANLKSRDLAGSSNGDSDAEKDESRKVNQKD